MPASYYCRGALAVAALLYAGVATFVLYQSHVQSHQSYVMDLTVTDLLTRRSLFHMGLNYDEDDDADGHAAAAAGAGGGQGDNTVAQLEAIGDVWGGGGGADFAWPKSVLYDQCVHPNKVMACPRSPNKFVILFYEASVLGEYKFVMKPPADGLLHFGCCDGVDMIYTTNRSLLATADIVEFDARKFPSPLPMPGHRRQLYMAFSSEAVYTLRNFAPFADMNFLRTFTRRGDIEQLYGPASECVCRSILKPLRVPFERRHSTPMVALVSNCFSYAKREDLLLYMINKMPIHSMGSCFHNREIRNDTPINDQLQMYKYTLAVENAVCQDYISEKFPRTFLTQSVPVIFSKNKLPGYHRLAPSDDSYVDLGAFSTLEAAMQFIVETAESKTDYMQHHNFRGLSPSSPFLSRHFKRRLCAVSVGDITQWCDLVRPLATTAGRRRALARNLAHFKDDVAGSCLRTGVMQASVPRENRTSGLMYDMNDPNREF